MRTRAAALVAVLLFAAGMAGCTKPGADSNGNPGTGSLGEATTPTAPPPSAGTDGPTEVAAEPTYPNDIVAYAKAAVIAWASKDEARLDQLEAPGGLLHTMLVNCFDCYDVSFYLSTCPQTGPYVTCTFFNAVGDELRLRGDPSLIGKPHAIPAVGSVFDQITFPSDNKAYAGVGDDRVAQPKRQPAETADQGLAHQRSGGRARRQPQRGVELRPQRGCGRLRLLRMEGPERAHHVGPLRQRSCGPDHRTDAQHRIVQFIYMP